MKASSVCGAPACPRPALHGQTRCAGHVRRKGRKWAELRRAKLRQQPSCACGREATQVHHRVAVGAGGDEWPALDQLESVCDRCHRERHR